MIKENKKPKNLANPEELKEHLSHRIGNVGEVKITQSYKVGDQVRAYGKVCKIVEVLDVDRFHVKNIQEPFDSFVILESEINTDCEFLMKALDESVEEFGKERLAKALIAKDEDALDLMVREDNRFSL